MQITRSSTETIAGPSNWFTGAVFIDTVATPSNGSRLSASSVHFTPGARTAWHTHPNGQTIWVIEGIGLVRRRGGPVELIRPGDRVFFEPGEEHWHGAAPSREGAGNDRRPPVQKLVHGQGGWNAQAPREGRRAKGDRERSG
jgi:quercetin dioxygenase-like cupin family protein